MVNLKNLMALRNAIDDLIEGEIKAKSPSVKRPTKKEQIMEKYRQRFFATTTKKQSEKNNKN